MDLPRPLKIALYFFTFIVLAFGFSNRVDWYIWLFVGLVVYGMYRFFSMQCHHRYTFIPMITVLSYITIFGIVSMRSMAVLALAMAFDIMV